MNFLFFVSSSENAEIDCCQLDNRNIISIKALSRYRSDLAAFANSAAELEKVVAVAVEVAMVCRHTVCREERPASEFWSFSTEQLDSLRPFGHEEHMQEGLAHLLSPLIILCAN